MKTACLIAALIATYAGAGRAAAETCTVVKSPFGDIQRCEGQPDRLAERDTPSVTTTQVVEKGKVIDKTPAYKPNGGKPMTHRRRGDACGTTYACDTKYYDADTEGELWCRNGRLHSKEDFADLGAGVHFLRCGGVQRWFSSLDADGWPVEEEATVTEILAKGIGCGREDGETGGPERSPQQTWLTGGYNCREIDGVLQWVSMGELAELCQDPGSDPKKPACHVVVASGGALYCSAGTCAGVTAQTLTTGGKGACLRYWFARPEPECSDAEER